MGETALDVAGLIYDANEFRENPNLWNAAWVAVDFVCLLLPFIPSPTIIRIASKLDDVQDVAKYADEAIQYGDEALEGFADFMKYIDDLEKRSNKYWKHVVQDGNFGGPLVTSFEKYNEIADSAWNPYTNTVLYDLGEGYEAGWNFYYDSFSLRQNGDFVTTFEHYSTGFDYFLKQIKRFDGKPIILR